MIDSSRPGPTTKGWVLLLALFLSALALRPQIIGLGPLLPRIQRELLVAHGVVGLLTTVPVLCMGVFAPLAGAVAGRLGTKHALTLCLAAIGVFGIGRAFAPDIVSLLVLTVAIGIPVAIAGALLPVVVKQTYPGRPVLATATYTAGIQIGSVASAAAAAPLAIQTGSWRVVVAVFSIAILIITGVWLFVARSYRTPRVRGRPPRLPLRSGVAWLLVLVFFLQSVPYYGLNAWLPAYLLDSGWPESRAGLGLAALNFGTLTGTVVIPPFADRLGARRSYLVMASLVVMLGIIGILLVPMHGMVLSFITGVALGGLYPIVLALPLDVATLPRDVGAVTGMMFGFGYTASALAPTGLGFIKDATGEFGTGLWLLVGVSALLAGLCTALSPGRLAAGVVRSGAGRGTA